MYSFAFIFNFIFRQMTKRIPTIFLLLLAAILVQAQSVDIKGTVVDGENGEVVPFATIAVFLPGEDVPFDGATTNIDGRFTVTLASPGAFNLRFSFIGFDPKEMLIEVDSNQREVNLGSVNISPVAISLDGVEVTAMERSAVSRLDRVSYRAEDFETARGGTAAELLNRLPGLSVSPDGEVSLRGTTDFVVYLNGRPTQMEAAMLLSQLPAGSVVGVDVITVPTASFDAQGKGGIINITTKAKAIEGLSVSANVTLGGAPWGNTKDDITGYKLNDDRIGSGVNMVFGRQGWLLQGGFSYNHRDVNSRRSGVAAILVPGTENVYKHMIASGYKPEWYETVTANFGFEKSLSAASSLNGSYFYSSRTEGRNANYLYRNFFGDADQNPAPDVPVDEHFTFNPNKGIRKGFFNSINLDYSYNANDNSKLSVGVLYEYSLLSHDVNNPNVAYDPENEDLLQTILHYRQFDETPLNALRLNVDYTWETARNTSISVGLQPQLIKINGGFDYDTLGIASNEWGSYSALENELSLDRYVHAGYVDLAGQSGKLSYKAGLRLEYTDQMLEIENPDYFSLFDRPEQKEFEVNKLDWFPGLHAGYQVSESDRLGFAASRRISRAPVKNMAPFLYRRHLEVYVVGDPQLKPEYINTAELSYGKTMGNQQVTLTGFYRGVEDAVFRVNTVYEEELILIRTFTNAGQTTAVGGEINANLEWGNRFRAFIGASLYHFRLKADIFGYREDHRSTNWSLKGNANLRFTDELRLIADVDVRSAEVTAQGSNNMRYMANAAMVFSPKKLPAWSFNFRALNILNSNKRGISTRAYNMEGIRIFYQDTDFYWYGPIAELTVTYQFNWRNQSKLQTESTFGKDEF